MKRIVNRFLSKGYAYVDGHMLEALKQELWFVHYHKMYLGNDKYLICEYCPL